MAERSGRFPRAPILLIETPSVSHSTRPSGFVLFDPYPNGTDRATRKQQPAKNAAPGRPRGRESSTALARSLRLFRRLLQALHVARDIGHGLRRLLHVDGADLALGGLDRLLEVDHADRLILMGAEVPAQILEVVDAGPPVSYTPLT